MGSVVRRRGGHACARKQASSPVRLIAAAPISSEPPSPTENRVCVMRSLACWRQLRIIYCAHHLGMCDLIRDNCTGCSLAPSPAPQSWRVEGRLNFTTWRPLTFTFACLTMADIKRR